MLLKKIFEHLGIIMFILIFFSCQNDDNSTTITSEDPVCETFKFEFTEGNGLDIRIKAEESLSTSGYTYQWDITKTTDHSAPLMSIDVSNETAFSWGVESGVYQVCLRTTSEDCLSGSTTCNILVVTDDHVRDYNEISHSKVTIIQVGQGEFTLEIIKK